jgi:hypothetical protein
MSPCLQPNTGAIQAFRRCAPSWQAYDFPQRGFGGPEMVPPQEFTGHGPLSPCTPQVPPALPPNNPVIWPTSSSSTLPGQLPGTSGTPSASLPICAGCGTRGQRL